MGTAATYGGLTRATYTTLNATDTASGGTISFAKLTTLYNAISDGSLTPSLGLCDRDVFAHLETLSLPQEGLYKTIDMIKGGLKGGTGYTALYHKGVPIVADRKSTTGYFFFILEDALDFFTISPDAGGVMGMKPFAYKATTDGNPDVALGHGFSWGGWKMPINQFSVVSQILFAGNFISWDPRRMGRLTGITGV